jgi:hypothetical protein
MVKSMFNAKPVILALEKGDQATIKASQQVAIIFNQFIDAQRISGLTKDAKGAKVIGTMVREGFADFVATGAILKSTASNYATGAARAFYPGVEWTPRTFQQPELAVPSATTGKTKVSGSVKTTDTKALVKTLSKALEQARIMQQDATASGIVDLIIELDPDFKESAE